MTRRAGTSSAETRERILAVATREFAAETYAKTSLRSICKKAEVTTGALYFFFNSKEDLFKSAVAPVYDKVSYLAKEHFSLEFNRNGNLDDEITTATKLAKHVRSIYLANEQAAEALIHNYNHPVVVDMKNDLTRKIGNLISEYLGIGEETFLIGADHDDLAITWLATLELDVIMHMLHDSSDEEAVAREAAFMLKFLRGGINALIMRENNVSAR